MRVRLLGVLLIAAVAMLAPILARAQDPVSQFVGRTVTEIRIDLAGVPQADSSLLALVEIVVGQPLSVLAVRETMDHFGRLARFDDVRVLVGRVRRAWW